MVVVRTSYTHRKSFSRCYLLPFHICVQQVKILPIIGAGQQWTKLPREVADSLLLNILNRGVIEKK